MKAKKLHGGGFEPTHSDPHKKNLHIFWKSSINVTNIIFRFQGWRTKNALHEKKNKNRGEANVIAQALSLSRPTISWPLLISLAFVNLRWSWTTDHRRTPGGLQTFSASSRKPPRPLSRLARFFGKCLQWMGVAYVAKMMTWASGLPQPDHHWGPLPKHWRNIFLADFQQKWQ